MSHLAASMLCILLALLTPANLAAAAGNAGFSLPLVSIHHKLNHTTGEIGELLLPEGDVNPTRMRPRVAPSGWPLYSVVVGVGSGGSRHFYKLALDFVGNLTWIRCRPCTPQVHQEGPIFDPAVSPKYAFVTSRSHYCKPPYIASDHNKCSFHATTSLAVAKGFLASDVFTFGDTRVEGLVFGCAHTADEFWNHQIVAGAMSMNTHETSFRNQLAARSLIDAKFSYCLFYNAQASTKHGFLRFGSDVPNHDHAQSTPLIHSALHMYYIGVHGVSMNGHRLEGIKPSMFVRSPSRNRGGSIIDVGTRESRMIREAYDILEAAIVADVQHRLGVLRARYRVPGYHLCFIVSRAGIYQQLPSITLHLAHDANLNIKRELLFVPKTHGNTHHACFLIFPDEEKTVLGAAQQDDTRFTFDLRENRLYFAPENCEHDSS